jgi:MYXO-CTERM domain-containing protein
VIVVPDAAPPVPAADSGLDFEPFPPGDPGSCNCTMVQSRGSSAPWALGLGVVVAGAALRRRLRKGTAAIGAALVATLIACSGKVTPPPGQLVLAVQTDMSIPKDVDEVRIQVLIYGAPQYDRSFAVGPDGAKIPATLGVIVGRDPSAAVTFRVSGRQKGKTRILREAITTIPADRAAVLKLPIQFLCDGSGRDTGGLDRLVESTCPEAGQTCINGTCQSARIDENTLPNFQTQDVFGGGTGQGNDGTCFDVLKCFDGAATAAVDLVSCTVERPVNTANVNYGLHMPSGKEGICTADNKLCIVPLDQGAAGWYEVGTSAGSRIQLPRTLCTKLDAKEILGVLVSPTCPTKTDAKPTCGPWSAAGDPNAQQQASVPTCTDKEKNGSETDVDCGGSCGPCGDNQACDKAADCNSKVCTANKCAPATCTDGVKNASETDIDCGGGTCPQCAVGLSCTNITDCRSLLCNANLCDCPAGMVKGSVPGSSAAAQCIDAKEVTGGEYLAFLSAPPPLGSQPAQCSWNASYTPTSQWPPTGRENVPVAFVDWCDAYMFCRSKNKRLCAGVDGQAVPVANAADANRSQWFRACSAAGTRAYPYGPNFGATVCNGVGFPGGGQAITVGQATQCTGGLTGLFDMSGNVAEWEDSCDASTGATDTCLARGGSFASQAADLQCNATATYARSTTDSSVGFRCCAF